jgi:hypothetical protein
VNARGERAVWLTEDEILVLIGWLLAEARERLRPQDS